MVEYILLTYLSSIFLIEDNFLKEEYLCRTVLLTFELPFYLVFSSVQFV